MAEEREMVNHPAHYGGEDNPYECIKIIEALGWDKDFNLGTAFRYMCRLGKKFEDKEIEDLEKSIWYLNRKLGRMKAEREARKEVVTAINIPSIYAKGGILKSPRSIFVGQNTTAGDPTRFKATTTSSFNNSNQLLPVKDKNDPEAAERKKQIEKANSCIGIHCYECKDICFEVKE